MTAEALVAAAVLPDKMAASRIVAEAAIGEIMSEGRDLYQACAKYEHDCRQRHAEKQVAIDVPFSVPPLALQLDTTQVDSPSVC